MRLIVYHRRIHREGKDVELMRNAAGFETAFPAPITPYNCAAKREEPQA